MPEKVNVESAEMLLALFPFATSMDKAPIAFTAVTAAPSLVVIPVVVGVVIVGEIARKKLPVPIVPVKVGVPVAKRGTPFAAETLVPNPPLAAGSVPVIAELPSAKVNPAPVPPAVRVPTVAIELPPA